VKICFVCLTAYPVLSGNSRGADIGGAELQQVNLAKLLRDSGYTVSFVTMDHGQPDRETIDGISIFKAFPPEAGIPVLRFLHPRLTAIVAALGRAAADVYYTRAAGMLPGVLAACARFRRFKYVFAGANDGDFIPGRMLVRHARDRWLYRFGLARANAVICQSATQQESLRRHFARDGVVIPNFFDAEPKRLRDEERDIVLWVGKIREVKRPALFTELALALPEVRCVMIGGADSADPQLFRDIQRRAEGIANLEFPGFQPFEATEAYFDRCRLLVNTSSTEGFPNTFLQALRRGIPIVSFVDPDGMIERHRLGRIVRNPAELPAVVRSLWREPLWPPEPLQAVFTERFSGSSVVSAYRRLFAELAA